MSNTNAIRRQSGFGQQAEDVMAESATQMALTGSEAGVLATVAREEQELKAAIVVARKFPRDEVAAYERIVKSCKRPTFAEGAQYRFPRGGQQIVGPSVDLAREMARCWGNMRYGLRVVSQDDDTMHIKGYAFDLETNSLVEAEDSFAKKIQRKDKRTNATAWVTPDERDLRELMNRRGAILVRNCILQLLPPDVTEDAQGYCQQTLLDAASGKLKVSREQAIRSLIINFSSLGITAAMIEKHLKHPASAMNAEELTGLQQIGRAILDGQAKREEFFDLGGTGEAVQSEKTADLNAKLQGRQPAPTAPKPPQRAPVARGEATEDDIEAARREAGQQREEPEVIDGLAPTPEVLPESATEAEFVGWASTFAPGDWDPDAAVLHVRSQMKLLSSKAYGKLDAAGRQALYDKIRKGKWEKK